MGKPKKFYPVRRLKYRFGCYSPQRRRPHIFRVILLLLILIIPLVTLLRRAESRLGSVAMRLASAQFENDISEQCNRIAADVLSREKIDAGSVISASVGDSGAINSLSADFSELNLLKTELTTQVTDYLSDAPPLKFSVPLGAMLSDNLMAAWGVKLPTRILTSGTAKVDFFDDFDSAGINQTRCRLMLRITVNARLHTVYEYTEKEVITDIPIAEKIIVGDVPQFSVGGSLQ